MDNNEYVITVDGVGFKTHDEAIMYINGKKYDHRIAEYISNTEAFGIGYAIMKYCKSDKELVFTEEDMKRAISKYSEIPLESKKNYAKDILELYINSVYSWL